MPENLPDKALRLYPLPPKGIEPAEIYKDLPIIHTSEPARASRPHVIVNMVSSVDGKATIGGKASSIGSDIDRRTMRNLRANSDAVMVGANTLRVERLSLGLDDASQEPQPLAVILTASGDVPLRANLLGHENQAVLVVVGNEIPDEHAEALRAGARVLRIEAASEGRPDLLKTLQVLKRDFSVERVLVEGGPTLNRAFISAGLVDELFLTLAPKLLGGAASEAQTILSGDLSAPEALSLISVHLADDELFLRYAISSATLSDTTP